MLYTHHVDPDRIAFTFDIEPLSLTIDTAVPFGLLLHEVLSNAMKHAFPGDNAGAVRISLHTAEGGKRELRVADNGVGLPESFEMDKADTLGVYLISILADNCAEQPNFNEKSREPK
ncbi:MAG: hypothetical protein GY801_24230 [bacterium]|nr:hypothetical protein [bacterium]